MVPAAILLACVTGTIAPLLRRKVFEGFRAPAWTRCVGWAAVLGILVPGVLLSAAMPWCYLPGAIRPLEELRGALSHIDEHRPDHVLILNTSSPMLNLYAWDILNHLSDQPQDVWVLSSACGVFSLERSGEAAFVIRTDRAGWLDNLFVRVIRSKGLKPGHRYETPLFSATLEEMTRKGHDVLAVRFELKRSLDHPGWLFLRWNGKEFEPIDIGAMEIGERRDLADTSDFWKAMF
jgi:hypothetical protein